MIKLNLARLLPVIVVILLLHGLSAPMMAAPIAQMTPFPTPTPGVDGRIIYYVQSGDTLWRVAAISGMTLEELRNLNNLNADEVIVPGQPLLLGLGGPAISVPTIGPAPTPTSFLPTPTPMEGTGTLCVLIYDDRNGDAVRQEVEPSLPGGAISVNNRDGSVSLTEDTTEDQDIYCFEELDEGGYNVSVAVPEGYNPTTILNYPVSLAAGDETYLNFGAQQNSETIAEIPETPVAIPSSRSPLLGILGGVFLLAGILLGIYAGIIKK